MDKILGVVGGIPELASRNDDDWADRLSHRYTTSLLMAFAVIVSTKQYVGEPIHCWCPAEFSGDHCKYAESYCWVKNTYFLGDKPFEDNKNEHIIKYYQWVPLILLGQALLFYLPIVFWRTSNSKVGVDVDNIVESSETFQFVGNCTKKEKTIASMTTQMDRFLSHEQEHYKGCNYSIKHCFARIFCYCCGYRSGNYLVFLYLVIKLVFLLNAIVQLFAIGYFLGDHYYSYGLDFFAQSWQGNNIKASPIFPRVTFCDFLIRKVGDNKHNYSVQCVLSINLFNEIVFLLLWWWLIFVIIVTLISIVKWSIGIIATIERKRRILKYLQLMKKVNEKDDENVQKFTNAYLKADGWFIIALVEKNTNTITAAEFVCSLWNTFLEKEESST